MNCVLISIAIFGMTVIVANIIYTIICVKGKF